MDILPQPPGVVIVFFTEETMSEVYNWLLSHRIFISLGLHCSDMMHCLPMITSEPPLLTNPE